MEVKAQQQKNHVSPNVNLVTTPSLQQQPLGQVSTPQDRILDSQLLYDQSNPQSASGTEFIS